MAKARKYKIQNTKNTNTNTYRNLIQNTQTRAHCIFRPIPVHTGTWHSESVMLPPGGDDDDGAGSPAAGLGPGTAEPDSRELAIAVPRRPTNEAQERPPTFGSAVQRASHDGAALNAKLLAVHARIVAVSALTNKDAVSFFDGVERKESNSQQLKGSCMACGKMLTSTASTTQPQGSLRVRVGLRGCRDYACSRMVGHVWCQRA